MKSSFLAMAVALIALNGCSNPPAETPKIQEAARATIHEGYPTSYIQALEQQQQQLEAASSEIGAGLQSVMSISRSWKPGSTITVAFNGGSKDLRKRITETVRAWTDVANLHLDFGNESSGFREWTTSDDEYRADIRIGFSGAPEGGYWSMVGRDSINKTLRGPNMASMNYEGFQEALPWKWQSIVLHEFGHALGFEHEHQNPSSTCEQEYRWNDDPGYVPTQDIYQQFTRDSQGRLPGIYTFMGGPPNRWTRAQVDFNMKKFSSTADLIFSSFDPYSIMKYYFDDRFFLNLSVSTASGCYSSPTFVLSTQDRQAVAQRYPHSPAAISTVSSERTRVSKKMSSIKTLSEDLREYFREMVQSKKEKKKQ